MQVDPIKLALKARGTKRLKLKYDKLLSNVAFNFNLRRYPKSTYDLYVVAIDDDVVGRCRLTL